MHCIGTVITSMKMRTKKPTYAAVQFGSGDFFNPMQISLWKQRGARHFFAASISKIRLKRYESSSFATPRILSCPSEDHGRAPC